MANSWDRVMVLMWDKKGTCRTVTSAVKHYLVR